MNIRKPNSDKKQRTKPVDLTEDIQRGFIISRSSRHEKIDAYWDWCKQNRLISVEIIIHGKKAICKIDTFSVECRNHPFRFSEAQLDELEALCNKHNWGKGSRLADVFSTLNFTTDNALAFAADAVKWMKAIKLPD